MKALIGIVMGSQSDWSIMEHAATTLQSLNVNIDCQVISAHRTPDLLFEYAAQAHVQGLRAIIAGAGGAAHLPGMLAAKTTVPILGVPIPSQHLQGLDSLLSIVQMPSGVPVATFAIGKAGAINAALFSAALLTFEFPDIAKALADFRQSQTDNVMKNRSLLHS
jgi:5-(carboxyamino)imidazole ribonucleotide mutase